MFKVGFTHASDSSVVEGLYVICKRCYWL